MEAQLDLDYLRGTQLYRPAPGGPRAGSAFGWAGPIRRLLAAGYAFLPGGYADGGYLFRGMQVDLDTALARGRFGHFQGEDEMAAVERAMGVYFLTSDPSDAVTVSRLPESPRWGGILAVPAALFNARREGGAAAVLGVGDGGLVFRYPLLTAPLDAADVACLFLAPGCADPATPVWRDRIVRLSGSTRGELEDSLRLHMARRGIAPASFVAGGPCPRLSTAIAPGESRL
jgi:hypothetical protein